MALARAWVGEGRQLPCRDLIALRFWPLFFSLPRSRLQQRTLFLQVCTSPNPHSTALPTQHEVERRSTHCCHVCCTELMRCKILCLLMIGVHAKTNTGTGKRAGRTSQGSGQLSRSLLVRNIRFRAVGVWLNIGSILCLRLRPALIQFTLIWRCWVHARSSALQLFGSILTEMYELLS